VYSKPTAPRSIGGVLDDSIKLYGSAFSTSWPLALVGQLILAVPVFIIRMQIVASPAIAGNPFAAFAVYKSPVVWLPYLVAVFLLVGINNALISRADQVATGGTDTVGASLAVGFRLWPRTMLLFFTVSGALIVGGILVGVVAAFVGSLPIVRAIFFTAVVVAAIYAWGRVFLCNIPLVVEDAAVFKSIETSWTLIRNHWWRTATVYTIAIIIAVVFYVVVAFMSGLVAGLMHGSGTVTTALTELISVAGGTVLAAFVPAVMLAIYYDLKLRRGGADLASRVNALAPQ
jgi:hypothetical protein